MKKLLLLALIFALAQASNAAYLYWQVSDTDKSAAQTETVSWFEADINAARIYTKASDGDSWSQVASIYLNGENIGGTAPIPSQSLYAIDIGSNDSYSYYVELGNYDGSQWYVAAKSNAETITYQSSGGTAIVTSLSDMARVSPWHAGGYKSVPEPTSGLMMLLGAAMLGLKRKKRSFA